MPTLRFEGHSDDTFGEVQHFKENYDNCAGDDPIEYLVVDSATGAGLVITGQFCPGNSGSWMIGVSNWDQHSVDAPLPNWPVTFVAQSHPYGYSPALVIEAPDGVDLRLLAG